MEQIDGPDGDLTAVVDPDGTIEVRRGGRALLDPSPYGLPTPHGAFPDAFEPAGREDREIDESYRLPHGKRRDRHHRATETTVSFDNDAGAVELDVRVATDGVAFRYRVLGGDSLLQFGEATGFRLPRGSVAWLHPNEVDHQSSGRGVPAGRADGEFSFPALFEVERGAWVLIAEAGVDGSYAAGRLASETGPRSTDVSTLFRLVHPPTSIYPDYPLTTPWRVAVVGDLATVVESTLVEDLVDGPRTDDDWVAPGRVAWSWWSDADSPSDVARQKEYVDYAAERGFEYVLVDEGWSDDWMPDLVEYADDRGVGVLVWVHWTRLNAAAKREERLPRWADWGIDGIKVDFMDNDDQGRLQFYDAVTADTAAHGLSINFHGSVVPSGLRRRWPHVMTYEGVMGAEHYRWGTLSPEHNAILPFTRNAVGPMDYTPVAFSADRRSTTEGHELALSVVYESGLQHFADSVEAYADRPLAEGFLERVPAAWDETRFLRGRPGVEATLARRSGDDWFVGCITAGPPRTVDVPASFLDAERAAVVTRDDETGASLVREEVTVAPEAVIGVPVPESGGFVVEL